MGGSPPFSLQYVLVPTTLISFLLALTSCYVVSPFLGNLFLPFYRNIDEGRKQYFNSLLFSTVHAIVVCTLSIIVVVPLPWTAESFIYHDSPYGFFALQFAVGYFMADIIIILSSPFMRKDLSMIVHHISSLVSVFLGCAFEGYWMPFVMLRILVEASTPFVNLRWILSEIKEPKTSPLFLFDAFGLTASFFIFRILPIPLLYYVFYNLAVGDMQPSATVTFPMPFKMAVLCLVLCLDFLNLYWCAKIFRGIRKVIKTLAHGTD